MMRLHTPALLAAFVLVFGVATANAQSQTGEIFGKVTDESGAVLPGVTVTLSGPSLLQPQTATTSGTGTYQFPRLTVGTYNLKFEIAGFKTVVQEAVQVTVDFSANISPQLGVSSVQEVVTVTTETPAVDTKQTGTRQTFTLDQLQSIPSARDPWVILQQTAGIAMDRENIGGNMSGQQSNYVSRGGNPTNNKWSLDGVDITDMSATGASPAYYDFDSFQEMTINTGGVDVTQQTGGVGINLVTKSGTDKFRGSSRFFLTNESVQANNINDDLRRQGATSGNPIQDIKDYGFEMGGPISRGRAWVWGGFGKQTVDVGVVGFYKPTAECQAFKSAAVALASPIEAVNECLNTDRTLLQQTNLKAEVQLFKGNRLSVFNNFNKKERNARGADDLHPIETTTPQKAVDKSFGKHLWNTGPNPTYKFGNQWVVSDRLLLDIQYAHVGNNFTLGLQSPDLRTTQPTLVVSTGMNGRSAAESVFIRPVNSVTFNSTYFLPGMLGADHSFKFGGYWRDSNTTSINHTGGYATVRFPTATENDCTTQAAGCQVDLTRDGNSVYDLLNNSVYVQDTITRGRVTAQLGLRFDYNRDKAMTSSIVANPLGGPWLPGIDFTGADPGVAFKDWSPRLGLTYNLTGDGRTLARANYARYYGQVGNGGVASTINPVGSTTLRYPWIDANRNQVAEAGEILLSANPLSASTNWSAANPANTVSANSVDPGLKNDTTDEFIVGVDREIGRGFAVGANYIYRKYGNFQWNDRVNFTSDDWAPVSFTPAASTCPGADGLRTDASRCPTVTYYEPTIQQPTIITLANVPGYERVFNGIELTGRKRLSSRWMMNTSFTYNATDVHFNDFAGAANQSSGTTGTIPISEDPTNRTVREGGQYDYLTSGSGIGNVYVNAKWLFKLSGLYELPWRFNVSGFYNARQGYPFEQGILSPSRLRGAGTVFVVLDQVGDLRLPNYHNVDFHVERPISVSTVKFVPSLDVFNVGNSNTVQAIRGTQNTGSVNSQTGVVTPGNANQIQAIVAPRVVRFGVRMTW
jgi:Carboxypeptidase regulatory-like domain/TonB-dependent Receptor Plug Domain